MIRPDLLSSDASEGIEVVQLTLGELPSSHVYMEAQIFAPDSSCFVLHESATPHGSDKDDPRHRYLVCDLDDNCALRPITEEMGATAPSISPDGEYLFYFVDETEVNSGRLKLKRVKLDGTDRQSLLVLDRPPANASNRPSRLYPLSTIRSDGKKIALSCFFGDGRRSRHDWGLMVFDLEDLSGEKILSGPSWCNIHPQYSRSTLENQKRDILIQENHGNLCSETGEILQLTGGNGADIHVIRDDGTDFRDMPWGRDGNEFCQGHQCWRGTSEWAITSTGTQQPNEQQLIESRAVAHAGHTGTASTNGIRNHLSRDFSAPCFFHFATDRAGKRLVTDAGPREHGGRVFVGSLHEPGESALSSWACLANANSSWKKEAHIHPFLSPDGTKVFFNSDESGLLQAYMIRGLEHLRLNKRLQSDADKPHA